MNSATRNCTRTHCWRSTKLLPYVDRPQACARGGRSRRLKGSTARARVLVPLMSSIPYSDGACAATGAVPRSGQRDSACGIRGADAPFASTARVALKSFTWALSGRTVCRARPCPRRGQDKPWMACPQRCRSRLTGRSPEGLDRLTTKAL